VELTDVGRIAYNRWQEIPVKFPFVKLGEFVVMPNHIHGIIIIGKSDSSRIKVSLKSGGITGNKNPMLHMNLSHIIRWYKGGVTYECRKMNPSFGWQSRFHDRIVRSEGALDSISVYIANNPVKWNTDKLNTK